MKKVLSVCLIALLLMGITGPFTTASASSVVTRISGSDRYVTAVEVSKAGWDYSAVVVLARGDNYADALAGVPLAYRYGAPILLTSQSQLPEVTAAEISRLGAVKVIILGGDSAVSVSVEEELLGLGLEVQRVAGSDRFETAAEIARLLGSTGKAVVVNGMTFPDALSAAPYAAFYEYPILLTLPDRLPAASSAVIQELGVFETIVVGGTSAVSNAVLDSLPSGQRIAGPDRFATSVTVAEHFQLTGSSVFVATGMAYADAITGAALAAKGESGLLLTGAVLPQSVRDYLGNSNAGSVVVLGGENAVSNSVVENLSKLLGLVGKRIEVLTASVITEGPGSGQVLRYPYTGYVTSVLDVDGDYVEIEFGSRVGWIHRDYVAVTDRDVDDIRLGWQFTSPSNNSFLQQTPDLSGYNTYAPVMYYVDNSWLKDVWQAGTSPPILPLAREQGYQVWLTIAQFGTSPNLRDESIGWIIDKAPWS
jgi:putative cell wall-binding protein